ncbi:hypothetical protein [Arthrobacter polaris]|nr:hypothetical protein [Arthrobacter polaris]UIK88993.1 hypothetical protein J0916_00295 [Arthrobacter polaris]
MSVPLANSVDDDGAMTLNPIFLAATLRTVGHATPRAMVTELAQPR